jgi:lipopolysaccharide biosynthesis glycosyltransferase
MQGRATYATILIGDNDAPGVLCLLRRLVNSKCPLTVIYDELSPETLASLQTAGARLMSMSKLLEPLHSDTTIFAHGPHQLDEAGLKRTFARFTFWLLNEYDWVIGIDADFLPLDSLDDLMRCWSENISLAAVPFEWGNIHDWFNPGLLALQPSLPAYQRLCNIVRDFESGEISMDLGGFPRLEDQAVLNHVFRDYRKLPKAYLMEMRIWEYCHAGGDRYDKFLLHKKVRHYVHSPKPWQEPFHEDPDPHVAVLRGLSTEWTSCGEQFLQASLSKRPYVDDEDGGLLVKVSNAVYSPVVRLTFNGTELLRLTRVTSDVSLHPFSMELLPSMEHASSLELRVELHGHESGMKSTVRVNQRVTLQLMRTRRPQQGSLSQVDFRTRGLLLNGKPFIVVGLYTGDSDSTHVRPTDWDDPAVLGKSRRSPARSSLCL